MIYVSAFSDKKYTKHNIKFDPDHIKNTVGLKHSSLNNFNLFFKVLLENFDFTLTILFNPFVPQLTSWQLQTE